MKNFLISLLIGGAVIGGTIAAVTFYNKAQQRDLAAGVLTAVQKGDINAMYDACQDLIASYEGNDRAQSHFEWAGCHGTQKVCVENNGGVFTEAPIAACNAEAVNQPGPTCGLTTSPATPTTGTGIILPEFGGIIPGTGAVTQCPGTWTCTGGYYGACLQNDINCVGTTVCSGQQPICGGWEEPR